ncbi:MAG: DUF7450 family protein, partial [Nitrososphaerota archaeon]
WDYQSFDVDGPFFDPALFLVNGVSVQLTNNFGPTAQSGTTTVTVATGDVFGFRIHTVDNIFGRGAFTSINHLETPDCNAHYLGYDVVKTKGKFKKTSVELTDQFEGGIFGVKKPERLYNSVDKNGEGINDPVTHMVGYKINLKGDDDDDDDEDMIIARVLVSNQFGDITLDVKEEKLLLVPSTMNHVFSPAPLETTLLDHFKCYNADVTEGTPEFEKRIVFLADQFETKRFEVKAPKLLCNPVQKIHDGSTSEINDSENHLLCYDVKSAKGEPKHQKRSVFTNNQFGPEQLDTIRETELCVPSKKTILEQPSIISEPDIDLNADD